MNALKIRFDWNNQFLVTWLIACEYVPDKM